MTHEQIEELRALYNAATPGQWQTRFLHRIVHAVRALDQRFCLLMNTDSSQDWRDCEFVASSHNAMPDLLDSLAALQAEITDLRDRYNAHLADLDHYRDAAEQRYAMGRDYAALPTVDPQADGDTQVNQVVAECAWLSQQLAEREAKRGTYLDARGIAPRQPDDPKPEEIIRRMRDDCDTPEGEN